MIAYLPEVYPDELAYSWFCRYYVHSGFFTHSAALMSILFSKCNNPNKEFLGHLNPEMEQAIRDRYSIDAFIIEHTMFPQYARFIPMEQKKNALYHIGHDFDDAHHLFSVLPRNDSDRYLKYCPVCAVEDRIQYGETYWHRIHQIRNMRICAKHKCYLHNSAVTAKSEQTFTLCPAETYADNTEVHKVNNPLEVKYAQYMTDAFNKPIDFENDTPISAILYNAMTDTPYMKRSGKTKYTMQLTEDIRAYYQKIGISDTASMSQIQRLFLGEKYDFSVVCQIGFFLNLSINQLVNSSLTAEQIQQEKSIHYMRDREPIDWTVFDDETAPILERIARQIYDGTATGRPERVSEKIIYRELDLPKHRLEILPKCKAIFDKYTETYEENWARRIVWGYRKLKANNAPFYWSDVRRITGVKKKNIEKIIPYIRKHTDKKTNDTIIALIGL